MYYQIAFHSRHQAQRRRSTYCTLFNEGKVSIQFTDKSKEGKKISEDGVLCSVYDERLWHDLPALIALMNADNDDADIQMHQDELQYFGSLEDSIKAVLGKNQGKPPTVDMVLEDVRIKGLRQFSEDQTRAFIEFRLAITDYIGTVRIFDKHKFSVVWFLVVLNQMGASFWATSLLHFLTIIKVANCYHQVRSPSTTSKRRCPRVHAVASSSFWGRLGKAGDRLGVP